MNEYLARRWYQYVMDRQFANWTVYDQTTYGGVTISNTWRWSLVVKG